MAATHVILPMYPAPLLATHYRYKRNAAGDITARKARTNLRGDLMMEGFYFSLHQLAIYMA